MTDPTTLEEYQTRYFANTQAFGYGVETGQAAACPFCGAAGFMRVLVLEFEVKGAEVHTCKECQRSGKFLFKRDAFDDGHTVTFRFVQTGGPTFENMPWLKQWIQVEGGEPATDTTLRFQERKPARPTMIDLHKMTEAERIDYIEARLVDGTTTVFIVDSDEIEPGKADRYVHKLRAKNARLVETARWPDRPVKGCTMVQMKVAES